MRVWPFICFCNLGGCGSLYMCVHLGGCGSLYICVCMVGVAPCICVLMVGVAPCVCVHGDESQAQRVAWLHQDTHQMTIW